MSDWVYSGAKLNHGLCRVLLLENDMSYGWMEYESQRILQISGMQSNKNDGCWVGQQKNVYSIEF